MHTLKEIAEKLKLESISSVHLLHREAAGGYAADLLSCAIKGAKKNYLWITLQSHLNIVAVASLLELAAVIITEGNRPDAETLERAEKEGVLLMTTPKTTFSVVSELAGLGITG